MSPRRIAVVSPRVEAEIQRVASTFGVRVRDARLARGWSVGELSERAGLSPDMVYRLEQGAACSLQTSARVAVALDRRVELELVDPRRRARANLSVDVIHSAMGEFEARHLRQIGLGVGIDEPYQHYQFAGRGDVIAWHLDRRAFLHIENRTRFPDFQEMAGSFNAKRAYLAEAIATRLKLRAWSSETHVIAAFWSAEVLHALRLRTESFRALCPDDATALDGWWSGDPPGRGKTTLLVVLDPLVSGRARPYVGLDEALRVKPRHRNYAELAARMGGAA